MEKKIRCGARLYYNGSMSQPTEPASLPQGADLLKLLNETSGPFDRGLGIVFTSVTDDAIEAEMAITPQHLQAYGIVHGGVYASIIESLSSTGAALHAMPRGQTAVGLENSTSFLHAVRGGVLRARGVPLQRGRRTQVWEGTIEDQGGRKAATGRVRMICLDRDAVLAGETVAVKIAETKGG